MNGVGMKKQVICINWGTKYGAEYINRLYGMVARNITPPFTFTAFTDTCEGVRPEVQCEDLPEVDYEMPVGVIGKWPKSRLWSAELGALQGPVLFIDLDVVITGSLDIFFEIGAPDDVVMARNPSTPFERLGQTSLFRFPVGKLEPIQRAFRENPQGIAEQYRFEQRYVTRNAPGGVKFFPRAVVQQFSHDCAWMFPLNLVLTPRLPRRTRVLIFAGSGDPRLAIEGRWSEGHPAGGLRHYLAQDWRRPHERSYFKYLRHFIKPAAWVADFWKA